MEMTWFWRHDQQMFKQSLMTMTSWLEAQAVIAKTDGCVVSIRKGVD
jgi:hypothetical protein